MYVLMGFESVMSTANASKRRSSRLRTCSVSCGGGCGGCCGCAAASGTLVVPVVVPSDWSVPRRLALFVAAACPLASERTDPSPVRGKLSL